MYAQDIRGVIMSTIKWKRLPNTMNARVLELALYQNGSALIVKDDVENKIINLFCLPSSSFNIYGEPYYRRGYSMYNSYNIECNETNSVIVWNNTNRTNSDDISDYYAYKLANIDLTVDININAQKTPLLLQGNNKQQLALKNIYMQYDGFDPVLFGDSDFDFSKLTAIKTDAPFVADKIYSIKEKIWNEMLTRIGISSVQFQKKERLVKDEVERSLGGTMAFRDFRLEPRKKACEEINEMFGTDIDVEFNDEGGVSFGELYNADEDNMRS